MNEVSTIAAAYAMSGFAVDATDVSDDEAVTGNTTSTQAQYGMVNAFANATNLVSLSSGTALLTTPAGNGTAPQATLNTLGNILATCVNSADTVSGSTVTHSSGCSTLFGLATKDGTSTGTQPTDTATAAINIAHHPGSNVQNLYKSASSMPPFAPDLTAQPNDFSLGISFTGGGLNTTAALGIDASGNVWTANGNFGSYPNTASKLSPLGVAISPSSGFLSNDFDEDSYDVAIDLNGNAWFSSFANSRLVELSSSGTEASPTGGYIGGGASNAHGAAVDGYGNIWAASYGCSGVGELLSSNMSSTVCNSGGDVATPFAIAVDSSENIWIANQGGGISEFTNSGVGLTNSSRYTGGGVEGGQPGIAIDAAGDVWESNQGGGIAELSNSGSAISPSGGYTCAGGIESQHLGIDGAGNVWAGGSGTVCEVSNSGVNLSPSTGYKGGTIGAVYDVAADGSGDLWVTNNNATVTELIGIAAPVVAPLASGVKYNKLGTRP
jgi:hypothetical protein